jgi:hypothetical protein
MQNCRDVALLLTGQPGFDKLLRECGNLVRIGIKMLDKVLSAVYTLSTESDAIHEQKDTVSFFVGKSLDSTKGGIDGFF